MYKMIIIEDKTNRQNDLYSQNIKDFDNVLRNAIDDEYTMVFDELKEKVFNFDNYEVIAVHESAFEQYKAEIIDYIKENCRKLNKRLVFFSGGYTSTTYFRKPEVLYLNEKIFYKNLNLFLNALRVNECNLQLLGYGENWEINGLNRLKNNINKFLDETVKYPQRFSSFKRKVQLDIVDVDKYAINISLDNSFISKDEIIKLNLTIVNIIKEKVLQ